MYKNIASKRTHWCCGFIFVLLQGCSDEHLSQASDDAAITAAEQNVEESSDKKEPIKVDPPVEEEIVFVDEDLFVDDFLPPASGPVAYPVRGGNGGPNHRCGNGIREHVEECDDGAQNSDITPGACRKDCTLPSCGDGVLDTDEECDDGNNVNDDDTCTNACRTPRCGDGIVQAGLDEECDDGNEVSFDGCEPVTCKESFDCGGNADIRFIQNTPRYVALTGVDTDNDCADESEPCASIQHAIDEADAEDTVILADGTYHQANIDVEKSIFIFGRGPDVAIVDGNAAGRIFSVDGNAPSSITVAICGLSITDGLDAEAAALFNTAADTTVVNVKINNHVSLGSAGLESSPNGGNAGDANGAIFNDADAKLSIIDSVISENSSTSGTAGSGTTPNNDVDTLGGIAGIAVGAITNLGDLLIDKTILDANEATGGLGGGATSHDAVADAVEARAGSGGLAVGGIFNGNENAKLTVLRSTISNHKAKGGNGGTASVGNATAVTRTTRSFGGVGGIAVGAIYSLGELSIELSKILANEAEAGPGGDANAANATSDIASATGGTGNLASGAIYSTKRFTSINTTYDQNFAIGGDGGFSTAGSGANASSRSGDGGKGIGVIATTDFMHVDKSTIARARGIGGNAGLATVGPNGTANGGNGGAGFGGVFTFLSDATFLSSTVSGVGGLAGAGGDATAGAGGSAIGGSADLAVGGIYSFGTLLVKNSTIFANEATAGDVGQGADGDGNESLIAGGIFNDQDTTIGHSIVASNEPSDCDGTSAIVSLGYNLESSADCGFIEEGDIEGGSPALNALADNGGPTPTHLPANGSPVIDNGAPDCGNASIKTDQRGEDRPVGESCDIGSVEVQLDETAM